MSLHDVRQVWGANTAFIDADSNGGTDIELVAAVTGRSIVVDLLVISVSADATCFLESGASTVVFPTINLLAKTTIAIPDPFIRTAAGSALNLSATITGTISAFVRYHLEG